MANATASERAALEALGVVDAVAFNPFSPGFAADPYRHYEALRSRDPVHRSAVGVFVLTRHRHVQALLREPTVRAQGLFEGPIRRFALRALRLEGAWEKSAVPGALAQTLLFLDPPSHTRIRALVAKAFTPRALSALPERVDSIVSDLLRDPIERGRVEVVSELALPLPIFVMCDLLGVPRRDWQSLRDWSSAVAGLLAPVMTEKGFAAAEAGLGALLAYFNDLAEHRRRRPGDDLFSALVEVESHGDRLTREELLASALLLFGAGHETTKNVISTGVLNLLRHPRQLRRLEGDAALLAATVEECLRYDAPIQLVSRRTKAPLDLGDERLPRGVRVLAVLGSANRDPDAFDRPDEFDISRAPNPHLSFSAGVHHCLGASLARLETSIVLRRLFVDGRALGLDTDEFAWSRNIVLRGLESLPLVLAP